MSDDLQQRNDLDRAEANTDRFGNPRVGDESPKAKSSQVDPRVQRAATLFLIAMASALVCCGVLAAFSWRQQWQETEREAAKIGRTIPELVAAPSEADQLDLVRAIKNFPNSPIEIGKVVPLGADAAKLTTLLSALNFEGTSDGISCYRLDLLMDYGSLGNKAVIIEIAGNPPRVIRRTIYVSDN